MRPSSSMCSGPGDTSVASAPGADAVAMIFSPSLHLDQRGARVKPARCGKIHLANSSRSFPPVRVYETHEIRNIALIGHGNSGKTSLTAGLLYTSGAANRLLRVDEGNTITDFDDEEIQRKITISTAIAATEWNKKKINLIDTPGFNIFINDTKASLVAADAAIVAVDGVAGVEVQTEKVWSFSDEFKLPRVIVINKLDRERSSFDRALESIQSF